MAILDPSVRWWFPKQADRTRKAMQALGLSYDRMLSNNIDWWPKEARTMMFNRPPRFDNKGK